MKKNLSYIIPILAVLFTTNLYGQIGNIIPDNRLPYEDDGTTLSWKLAGYDGDIPYAEETINVQDYGAVGDGETDATIAIRNAINDANPDILTEILFPEGTYLIYGFPLAGEDEDVALDLPPNIILKGVTAKDSYSNLSELKFLIGEDGHDPDANYIPHCIKISGTASNKIENVGIEDLTIKRYNELTTYQDTTWNEDELVENVQGRNIIISNAENCWVIGVESDNTLKNHINIVNSNQIEITGCYIHDPQFTCGGGFGYGVCVSNSNYCLVENNIFSKCRHSMILAAHAYNNVFGYNFSREPRQTNTLNAKDYTADICLHGNSGNPNSSELKPEYNLFEGNIVWKIKVDRFWGSNGKYNTFFRNRGKKYGIWFQRGNDHQTLVNNYVKCYHYFYCWYKHPRRLTPHHYFEKNTIASKVNFWGRPYTRTWSDKKYKEYPNSWNDDISYYYEEQPGFMTYCNWPFHPRYNCNPAKKRWDYGGIRTVSRDYPPGYIVDNWNGEIIISDDYEIPEGHCVIISPGSIVRIQVFCKLIVKGSLIAEGTENDSILFTIKDYYPGMNTDCYGISFEMVQNPGESSLKYCKFEHFWSREWPSYNFDVFTPTTHGGAIYVENYDNLSINKCSFMHNTAYVGGAICLKNSNITIENSEFRDNFGDCGGAIMSSSSSPIVINNIIDNNYSVGGKDLLGGSGGGIYLDDSDNDNIYLINNVISNNIAAHGGGIAICNCNDKVVCMNNTITDNDGGGGGGGIWIDTSNDIFINNIFWDNTAYYGPQLNITSTDLANMSFYNCDIQGGIDGIDFAWVNFEGVAVNIIDANPNFIGSGDHPYAITWNTECYNNGLTPDNPADSLLEYILPTKDPSGNPRTVVDTIDIGAYEAYEPGIYVEDRELGFGEVNIEEHGELTFEIWNDESAASYIEIDSITVRTYIYIDSVETEVSGFTVEANAGVLPPGFYSSRDVNFNPELVFEDYYGEIIIYSSDPYFPEVSLNLTGRGIPSEYQEVSGEISSDETWSGYILITGDVTVTNGATLTIAENAEVYIIDGYELVLESGHLMMNGAKMFLRNDSEVEVYDMMTLAGRSLVEVTSGSVLRMKPGSELYGTEHEILVDEHIIPGDRIIIKDGGYFMAKGTETDSIYIGCIGDYHWDGITITGIGDSINTIEHCHIENIGHIVAFSTNFSFYKSSFTNSGYLGFYNTTVSIESSEYSNNSGPIYSYESWNTIIGNIIENNGGGGISASYPSSSYNSIRENIIRNNLGKGIQLYDLSGSFYENNISNNTSYGFVALGNSNRVVMVCSIIEDNGDAELFATRNCFPNLYYHGNTIADRDGYEPGTPDQYLLMCAKYDEDPIDVSGNIFPNENDLDFEDRFYPFYEAYIFEGEKPPERNLYDEGITKITEEEYDSAKVKMTSIVDDYPETVTAENALQWLMYLEKFSGHDYAELRSYIESIDDISYPNLERTKYNTITSTYIAEENYDTAIARFETILANPPSEPDSVFAYIDQGYCYLKWEEQGGKEASIECRFKPRFFKEFISVSQNLIGNLLDRALQEYEPSTSFIKSFALNQNYPNPMKCSTIIYFSIPKYVKNSKIKIYNIKGQLVKQFSIAKDQSSIGWNGRDEHDKLVANGIYFYKLTSGNKSAIKKMVLLR